MRKGFTLIELLVVIAIIAILAAILFPVFAKAREKARQASCQSNLKQIILAVLMYVQDYDERTPYLIRGTTPWRPDAVDEWVNGTPAPSASANWWTWGVAIYPYVKNAQLFQCPSQPPGFTRPSGCWRPLRWMSYGINYQNYYRPWNHVSMAQIEDPSGTIAISDSCTRPFTCYRVGPPCPHAPRYDPDLEVPGPTGSGTTRWAWVWRHNDGVNHAFFDGHVKWMRRWQQRHLTRISD